MMAEKGQTSSMTSVTEEEISAGSESDTTESSYSNITSSLLSSTDTDDKLTPGLIKISISNTNNGTKRTIRLQKEKVEPKNDTANKLDNKSLIDHISQTRVVNVEAILCKQDTSVANTHMLHTNFVHPYGSNPIPLKYARLETNKKCKYSPMFTPSFNYKTLYANKKEQRCTENFVVNGIHEKESTDERGLPLYGNRNNNNEFDVDTDENNDNESVASRNQSSSFLPDLSSENWYQAPCFDRYWSHYRFGMEWYHMHVQAVQVLQAQIAGSWYYTGGMSSSRQPWLTSQRENSKSRRSRKSSCRNRSKGRARHKNHKQPKHSHSTDEPDRAKHSRSVVQKQKNQSHTEDEDELEMEITDEMLDFFATSYKHKLERDKAAEQGPISHAPTERPGVRRTQEMRELYGSGAPMIQAMETAMQMTFDRFLDKFQPSSWPNMPLKINFTK